MADAKVDIWMPLAIGDYLKDTQHLDAERHGCYLLWIMHYWVKGPLPNDMENLVIIGRLRGANAHAIVRANLEDFFKLDDSDGRWHHGRIEFERAKAMAKSGIRSGAGALGAARKWGATSQELGKLNRSERLAKARELGRHTSAEWHALMQLCGACVKCGDCEDLVKDHITPLYQGGSDAIENIQPMCRSCNAAKGPDKTDYRPADWRECLAKRLANARQTPAQSQSQSPKEQNLELSLLSPGSDQTERFKLQVFPETWNKLCGSLPKIKEFSDSRRKKVKARVNQGITPDRFAEAVKACTEKPFLRGENDRGWTATFDWLVDNDRNIEKAITNPYGPVTQIPLPKPKTQYEIDADKQREDRREAIRKAAIQ